MVLHNPNNWHWVNKDTSAWAREYLEENICTIAVEDDGVSAKVEKVLNMDGDVDVSQRKGKVITLFDIKLQLEYEGVSVIYSFFFFFLIFMVVSFAADLL